MIERLLRKLGYVKAKKRTEEHKDDCDCIECSAVWTIEGAQYPKRHIKRVEDDWVKDGLIR